ncbi:Uncharacterised protein [Chryseobacterium taihuense]|jgi:hypothetical protein|uniref:Uncharacterized protein n=2 Tax=Flavobacteriia TaxID=117743 RepID=A0A4U8WBD9_9FLAO|nr:hypothetical protein [Sinomicrobium oceani]GMN08142.1 hypothetical protein MTsPCn5_35310 [Croceitalea sp. MTPC5]VFB03647.1 Uncharacterised protein [Chryseobacterium taihuense]|tara:strand:+ start:153 stop:536 length:384 start_codon:yes stop_codon:yes gene_type:complete
MTMETYKATLKHDTGKVTLTVVSLSGKQRAIQQITAVEGCPECAIVDIVKIDNDTKQQNMKAKTIDEAKSMAKEKSLETQYRDEAIYIIYCNRTEYFYVDIDSLIRLWERLIGYYENGKYTDAETNS